MIALAVTGGDYSILNGNFYLFSGSEFDGQYRGIFGGTDFTQKIFTEEIRQIHTQVWFSLVS